MNNPSEKLIRKFGWVGIAVLSATLALSSWAVSSPVGSSPDDDYHNVSIWCGQGLREDLCEEGPTPDTVLVPKAVWTNAFCFAAQPDKSGFCEHSEEKVSTIRVNSLQGLYPAGYYWAMSWFASDSVDSSVIMMRLANAVLAVSVFALLIVFLPVHLRRIPILSVMVTLVPLGMFVIPSVNPSSWLLIAVPTVFAATLGFFLSINQRNRLVFGAMVLFGMVLGFNARADAPAYLLLAVLVASILSGTLTSFSKKVKITALISSVVIFAFVIWRYIYPLFSTLQGVNFGIGQVDQSLQSFMYNLTRLPDLFVGAFGTWGLGWLDTPMPSAVWAITFGLYLAFVFTGVRYFDFRQSMSAGVALFALFAVPLQFLWANSLSVGQIIQPRYLLPMLAILAGVASYRRVQELRPDFSRGQLWIIGIGLISANTLALHTNLRRYLTGLDGSQMSLNRGIEWWWIDPPLYANNLWFSPNNVWLGGSLAFAIFLVALWKLRGELGLNDPVWNSEGRDKNSAIKKMGDKNPKRIFSANLILRPLTISRKKR